MPTQEKVISTKLRLSSCQTFGMHEAFTDTKRFAFYQAGKCLVQTLLLNHPKISLFKLSKDSVVSSTEGLPPIETRTDLETFLIGFYAGKAGELFTGYPHMEIPQHQAEAAPSPALLLTKKEKALKRRERLSFVRIVGLLACTNKTKTFAKELYKQSEANKTKGFCSQRKQSKHASDNLLNHVRIKQFLCQSDAGLFSRTRATFLVQSLLVNGSTYSQNIFHLQKNSRVGNLNLTEIKDKKVSDLFIHLEERIKNLYLRSQKENDNFLSTNRDKKESLQKSVTKSLGSHTSQWVKASTSPTNNLLGSKKRDFISQKKEISAWCEEIVCQALTFSVKPYGHWFRIYLPQIETHQRRPVSRDQFFKRRRELGFGQGKPGVLVQNRNFCIQSEALLQKLCIQTEFEMQRTNKSFGFVKLTCKQASNHATTQATGISIPRLPICMAHSLGIVLEQTPAHLWPQELGYGMCHTLVLNTFSQAFNIIGRNRELLDLLTDHLIRFGKIRAPEILRLCSLYIDLANSFSRLADREQLAKV